MNNDGLHLLAWQGRRHLGHFTDLGTAFPHPGVAHLQRSHLLVQRRGQLDDFHHITCVLGDVHGDVVWHKDMDRFGLASVSCDAKVLKTFRTVLSPFPWRQTSHVWLHSLSSQTSSKWVAITARRHLSTDVTHWRVIASQLKNFHPNITQRTVTQLLWQKHVLLAALYYLLPVHILAISHHVLKLLLAGVLHHNHGADPENIRKPIEHDAVCWIVISPWK